MLSIQHCQFINRKQVLDKILKLATMTKRELKEKTNKKDVGTFFEVDHFNLKQEAFSDWGVFWISF